MTEEVNDIQEEVQEEATLDDLLRTIEKNKEDKTEEFEVFLPDIGKKMNIRTMRFEERKDFSGIFSSKNITIGSVIKNKDVKKIVYKCLNLGTLAQKALDKKLISNLYSVVDYLFSANDMMEILATIIDINNIGNIQKEKEQEIEELKN